MPPDRPAFSACRGPPAGPGVSDPRAGAGQLPRLHPLLPLRRRKAAVQKQIEEYSNVVRLPNKGTNQVKTSAEDMKNKAGYKD